MSCAAYSAREQRHALPIAELSLADGEERLERALHRLDVLEVQVYDGLDGAPGRPIDVCAHSNSDVIEKDLAWRLMVGKIGVGQEKKAESEYYRWVRDETPARLLPLVQLRTYYHEALRDCALTMIHGDLPPREESTVTTLFANTFQSETSTGFVLVDFMTHWCWPCKRMEPSLERLAREYQGKLRVGRLTADRNMVVTERFDLKVFPTLVMFRDGKEVARLTDARPYVDLRAWVDRMLDRSNGG